jgi:hypothetical protein
MKADQRQVNQWAARSCGSKGREKSQMRKATGNSTPEKKKRLK